MNSKKKALALAHAAWEKNSENPVLMDVRNKSDVTDYFLVCSANSTRGVKTIVDNIEKKLDELDQKIIGIEGYAEGNWVLVDSADVIVHVFYEPYRKFYDIESLWSDAPRLKLAFEQAIPGRTGSFDQAQIVE